MEISCKCRICKEERIIKVSKRSIELWKSGMHIQDAMPDVSADDREMLMSQICPTCWDRLFGEEE